MGKSTLLNALVGEKLSAVSPKPNTTRNRITGIKTTKSSQIVFLDTPGIYKSKNLLGKTMVRTARDTLAEGDLVIFMIEVSDPFGPGDRFILKNLSKPVVLVINKIDTVKKSKLLTIINQAARYEDKFLEIIPISAETHDGVDILENTIVKYLPEGPKYFPDDMITDQPERFLVAELIREKIFILTHEEIPYRTAVAIEDYYEDETKGLLNIHAVIYVERKNHKGIVIGKRGALLKEIGTLARKEIEGILGIKVYLELWVKVMDKWTDRSNLIREFGYST